MRKLADGDAAAGKGNLGDGGNGNEEFPFLHSKSAADQKCDGPCFAVEEKIVNDAKMLFAVIDFVTGNRDGAAQVGICGSEMLRNGRAAQGVLAADRNDGCCG